MDVQDVLGVVAIITVVGLIASVFITPTIVCCKCFHAPLLHKNGRGCQKPGCCCQLTKEEAREGEVANEE